MSPRDLAGLNADSVRHCLPVFQQGMMLLKIENNHTSARRLAEFGLIIGSPGSMCVSRDITWVNIENI